MSEVENKINLLMELAKQYEAHRAKALTCNQIVVDNRVQLKCEVPKCPNYGVKLMCPPNVIKSSDLKEKLQDFSYAILVQVDSPLTPIMKTSIDRAPDMSSLYKDEAFRKAYEDTFTPAKKKVLDIVNHVEAKAFSIGFRFATGFTAGSCPLCEECVTLQSGQPCRFPFKARPSMEGAGIDVYQTAINAGLPFDIPVNDKAVWNGLVLLG